MAGLAMSVWAECGSVCGGHTEMLTGRGWQAGMRSRLDPLPGLRVAWGMTMEFTLRRDCGGPPLAPVDCSSGFPAILGGSIINEQLPSSKSASSCLHRTNHQPSSFGQRPRRNKTKPTPTRRDFCLRIAVPIALVHLCHPFLLCRDLSQGNSLFFCTRRQTRSCLHY